MPLLNNEPVMENDKVYDLVLGYGTVVSLRFGEIHVRFASGIRITYDGTGHYGGVRRLYWHNPVVVEPPKSQRGWDALTGCIAAIKTFLNL